MESSDPPRRGRAPLRAILFDAGNTLLRLDYPAIAAELSARGVDAPVARVQEAEWRARVRLDRDLAAAADGGASTESRATAARYVAYVLDELGVSDDAIVEAMAAWRRSYNAPVGPWNTRDPAAEPALVLARAHGLVTGVVSNSNGTVRRILGEVGLLAHLDFVLDSQEEGIEKPNTRIFRLALDRAGVDPAEAAYVGDIYSVDVRGARAAGVEAVLLDPGACWGRRDCLTARDVLAAVELLVTHSGNFTNG